MTSPDLNLNWLETEFIKKYLTPSQTVLDIGSGDGIATIEFAKKVKKIIALEISPHLINLAKRKNKISKIKNIDWVEGSVRKIDKIFPGRHFQVIVTKRCLINLPNWQNQKEAIGKIGALLNPGDYFLLAEGFKDTFRNLQNLRKKYGLKTYNIVHFNRYFERQKFEDQIKKDFEIIEQNNFGLYYFLSHCFYPALIKPKEPKFASKFNQLAARFALNQKEFEKYGYINFYALKKKSK